MQQIANENLPPQSSQGDRLSYRLEEFWLGISLMDIDPDRMVDTLIDTGAVSIIKSECME